MILLGITDDEPVLVAILLSDFTNLSRSCFQSVVITIRSEFLTPRMAGLFFFHSSKTDSYELACKVQIRQN